jgi:tRNA uridine 5-carboxymethylaminomethyl modification enzyme
VTDERWQRYEEKYRHIEEALAILDKAILTPSVETNTKLSELSLPEINATLTAHEYMRRPEVSYEDMRSLLPELPELRKEEYQQVEISIRYEGYIKKQQEQVDHMEKLENQLIPEDIVYENLESLRSEAREKLAKIRPLSLGQASRISGVSPADISVLAIYLKK